MNNNNFTFRAIDNNAIDTIRAHMHIAHDEFYVARSIDQIDETIIVATNYAQLIDCVEHDNFMSRVAYAIYDSRDALRAIIDCA